MPLEDRFVWGYQEQPQWGAIRRPRQTQGGARQGIILLTLVSDYYRSRRSSSSNYYYYYYYYYGFQKLR